MTGKSKPSEKLRALFLAALMVFSVFAGSMALAGTAAAANTSAGNSSITPSQVATDSTNDHTITLSATDVDTSGDGNQVFVVQMPNALDLSSSQITNINVNDGAVTDGSTNVDSTNNYVNLTLQDDTSAAGSTSSDDVSVTFDLTEVVAPSSPATAQAQFGIDADASGIIGDDAEDSALTDFQQLVIGSSGVEATAVSTNATFDTTTGDAVNVTVEHNDSANSAAIALYDANGDEVFEYNDGDSGASGVVNIDQDTTGETVFTLDVETITANNDFNLGNGTIYASATDAGSGTALVSNSDSDVQTDISLGGLDVTSFSGPRVAANDTEIDYTVTLNNTGSAEVTQDVSLLVSNDGGDISASDPLGTSNTQQTETDVTVAGGSSTTVTFTVNTADLPGADSNVNNYEVAGYTAGSPIGFSSANLVAGSNTEGSVTINVVDDTSEQQEGVDVELWLEGDFDDQNLVLAEKTTNAQGSVTFTGLAVGADSNNPIRYTARAGANQPDLSSTTTTLSLFEPTQTSDSSTVVTDRLVQPERIEVEPDRDSAVADGSDQVTFTATLFGGVDGVPNSDDDRPIEGYDVTVTDDSDSVTYDSPDSVSGDERIYETNADGEITFSVSSGEVQTVDFTVEGGDGTGALTETVTGEFVLSGEGNLAGTVNNKFTTSPIENASVWVVSNDDYETNEYITTVDIDALDDDDTVFLRLRDNETNQEINNDDYDLRRANEGTYVRKVDELNESDSDVGQGYALIDANGDGTVQFNHTRIADENYYAQVSLDAENSSARAGVIDEGTESFVNVTSVAFANNTVQTIGGTDPVVFEPTANLTLEAAEQKSVTTRVGSGQGANYVDSPGFINSHGYDTAGTTDNGRFVLDQLPTDFQNGTGYVAIADDTGFTTDFADVTITEDGQLTFEESQGSNEFFLEPVPVEPDGVDIQQVGTKLDADAPIVEFDEGTGDDTFQEVPRDGTIDVFDVTTSAEDDPVNATATVSIDTDLVDGEFVNIASGEFVGDDDGDNTIELITGDDGQAQVWYQSDESGETVNTSKTAVLDADSSVEDTSNLTFVGVTVFDSGSISGDVRNEDEGLPNTVIWTREFVTEGGDEFEIVPQEDVSELNDEGVLEADFEITYDPIDADEPTQTATVTGADLRNYDFTDFEPVSVAPGVSDFNLLRFPGGEGRYTMDRVPAQDDTGVDYTRLQAVQYETGDTGNGTSSNPVRTGFTEEGDVVITGAVPVRSNFDVVSVSPSGDLTADAGQEVSFEVVVENTGTLADTQEVEFVVGGDVAANQTVELDPGVSDVVTLNVTAPEQAGTYDWSVRTDDDESEQYTLTVGESNSSNLERFDTNQNGQIDQQEVVDAISAFYNDDEIGGEPVVQQDVVDAINAFYSETQL